MGLDTVLNDIQKRGDEEVEAIRRDGKAEAERLLREAQSKKKALLDGSLSEARKAGELGPRAREPEGGPGHAKGHAGHGP